MRVYLPFIPIDASYLLIYGSLLITFSLFKLRTLIKKHSDSTPRFVAFGAYVFRACSILALWYNPYKAYNVFFTALAYSLQSFLLTLFITPMRSNDQDAKMMKDFDALSVYLKNLNEGHLFILALWNAVVYVLLFLSTSFEGDNLDATNLAFLVASYWITAQKLGNFVKLNKSEKNQAKLDLVVVCLIMLGLLNLVSTVLGTFFPQYMAALLGSLYIFETAGVMLISEGYIVHEAEDLHPIKSSEDML